MRFYDIFCNRDRKSCPPHHGLHTIIFTDLPFVVLIYQVEMQPHLLRLLQEIKYPLLPEATAIQFVIQVPGAEVRRGS